MSGPAETYDPIGQMIAYEEGVLPDWERDELFQHLLTTGLCWQLRGHYGRTAVALVHAGRITPPKED